MKKTYIKWILFGILVVSTIFLIVFLNFNNSRKSRFLNYPVNYSLCNNNELDIKIYSTKKEISFFDLDNISNVFIEDNEKNCYDVKIIKITKEEKVLIDGCNYYPYNIRVLIPITSKSIFVIEDAMLKINNIRGEEIGFNIGNISMLNGEFYTIAEVKSIVGMTKNIDNYSTLDKIKIELYNFQLYDIHLKDIKIVSNIVETEYQDIHISPNEILDITIPLSYLENSFIDNIGILLTWEYQNALYLQIISPYVLFKTSTKHTKPVIQVYEIY